MLLKSLRLLEITEQGFKVLAPARKVAHTTTMPATPIDLTPFGFTPTESRVYEVLRADGPGTGYALARSAGLARANAYSALEGLVAKGAARQDDGQPKRFRPEPPQAVLARISSAQGQGIEELSRALDSFGAPASAAIVEIESPKAALQLLTHDIGRAERSVNLMPPAEASPRDPPALRLPLRPGPGEPSVRTD